MTGIAQDEHLHEEAFHGVSRSFHSPSNSGTLVYILFCAQESEEASFCFHGHYALKPRFRPAPGWVEKVCVCVGPQCLISVHMVLFSMLKKCECSE